LRRLHEKSQPLEQLDAAIKEIKRLMLGSTKNTNKEKMGRKEATTGTSKKKQ